jgi:hypothetical protein
MQPFNSENGNVIATAVNNSLDTIINMMPLWSRAFREALLLVSKIDQITPKFRRKVSVIFNNKNIFPVLVYPLLRF